MQGCFAMLAKKVLRAGFELKPLAFDASPKPTRPKTIPLAQDFSLLKNSSKTRKHGHIAQSLQFPPLVLRQKSTWWAMENDVKDITQAELDDNRESQENEVLALEAIYQKEFSHERRVDGTISGQLAVTMDFGEGCEMTILLRIEDRDEDIGDGRRGNGINKAESVVAQPNPIPEPEGSSSSTVPVIQTTEIQNSHLSVRFLPPITLAFHFPVTYPSRSAPDLSIACRWLTARQRTLLHSRLTAQWEAEKDVCLYLFAEETVAFMMQVVQQTDETQTSDSTQAIIKLEVPPATNPTPYLNRMTDYLLTTDTRLIHAEFESTVYTCGVCFETRLGTACFRFGGCGHVFCRECVRGYFTILITEGSPLLVGCLDPACKKVRALAASSKGTTTPTAPADTPSTPSAASSAPPPPPPLSPTDLQPLSLSPDLISRYTSLIEAHNLSLRTDVTYCPRPTCQSPVIRDPSQPKLCICPACQFAFCHMCSMGWHGSAQFCRVRHWDRVSKEYVAARDAGQVGPMRRMEVKYGKKTLERMVREWEDEKETRIWKEENSQSCPTCSASVEKTSGCNHMICQLCNTHFCYLCGVTVAAANPYKHYNDHHSTCYNMLFAGITRSQDEEFPEQGDDEEDDWEVWAQHFLDP
ncbi:hypothetical protein DFS34DRAFT_591293 [Phlyctochytrium arcticum]|nr:hypothetical protein DFS34DRAFT_591293 [Phlyctochytrium arcticum]